MIGLEEQIETRREKNSLKQNSKISYSYIAKRINNDYHTAKRKVQNGSFTVDEALKIYEELEFKPQNNFEAFKYLFTEK